MSWVGVTRSGRASGLWSPMVSDHEHNWGYWGRVGVTRSGLQSPMLSDHEHNWGQLGPGGCHALRGLWFPTVSDPERNRGHWGRVGVTRSGLCSPTWSPIMSTIGANWGRVGVTLRGLWSPWSPIMSTIGANNWRAGIGGRVSRASGLLSPMVSDHELGGWHALGPVVVGGCHAFGTWSPTVSDHEHNWGLPWSPRPAVSHGLRS